MKQLILLCAIILITLISLGCTEESKVYDDMTVDSQKLNQPNTKIDRTDSSDISKTEDFNLNAISELRERDINNPLIGKPVSLRQLLFEQPFNMPSNEAIEMANRGHPFVLLVNENGRTVVYYIFNQNAEFMGKELAAYCGKTIKLTGKLLSFDNMNFFFANKIITNK